MGEGQLVYTIAFETTNGTIEMTEIALYNALRKIPEISDTEAKEAVADIASSKDVATKADIAELKGELKGDIREIRAELKYLRWLIVIVVGIAVGIIKYL